MPNIEQLLSTKAKASLNSGLTPTLVILTHVYVYETYLMFLDLWHSGKKSQYTILFYQKILCKAAQICLGWCEEMPPTAVTGKEVRKGQLMEGNV